MAIHCSRCGKAGHNRRAHHIRRNLDGFVSGGVFHPIRGSKGYNTYKAGDAALSSAGSSKRGKRRKKRR